MDRRKFMASVPTLAGCGLAAWFVGPQVLAGVTRGRSIGIGDNRPKFREFVVCGQAVSWEESPRSWTENRNPEAARRWGAGMDREVRATAHRLGVLTYLAEEY